MSNPNRHPARIFEVLGAEMLISSEGNQMGNQSLISLSGYECKLLILNRSGRSAAW